MNAEDQMRKLLTKAAELPDLGPAPADQLVARGQRQRRRRRTISAAAAAVAVAGAAIGLPALGRAIGTGQSGSFAGPTVGPTHVSGPTAAQLSRFRWSTLPASPLGPRSQPIVAWTGHELLELGGQRNNRQFDDGAAFDPATGRWHRIATAPVTLGYTNGAVSVWAGRKFFMANESPARCPLSVPNCGPLSGLYDPAANRWSATPLPPPMDGLTLMGAVWTGRDVILAGVNVDHSRLGVAAYDPATKRWKMITPRLPARHPAQAAALVATPGRVILWSFWDRQKRTKDGFSIYSGIDVLALSRGGAWHDVTGRWPQDQTVTAPVFAGGAILVSPGQIWCGTACPGPYFAFPGYFADPATLARTPIPRGPLGQADPAFVWTGRAIIAVNLNASISGPGGPPISPDDMAAWNPGSRWFHVPAPPGHPPISATPVWTGTTLLALTDNGTLLTLRR